LLCTLKRGTQTLRSKTSAALLKEQEAQFFACVKTTNVSEQARDKHREINKFEHAVHWGASARAERAEHLEREAFD
jgi:hypothetical protein